MKKTTYACILLMITFCPLNLPAFGLWQCAGMLAPELNPLCWDICGFEFGAEALYLDRCDHSGNVDFTSLGMEGPIVLRSTMLDSGWKWGYALFGGVRLRGCKAVEIVWMPEMSWKDSKTVSDDGNQLFSVYSDFGASPFEGFDDVEGASKQLISLESTLETIEVNVKRMWGIFRGCFLYGYRYQCLDEELEYEFFGEGDAWYSEKTAAKNSMHGFQAGLEFCIPCTSCFSLECFGKGAFYSNSSERIFKAKSYSLFEVAAEREGSTRSAWGVDAGVKLLYEWSRAAEVYIGYRYFSFHHVALGIENFKADESPFSETREKFLDNNGFLSYQGISIGAHVVW